MTLWRHLLAASALAWGTSLPALSQTADPVAADGEVVVVAGARAEVMIAQAPEIARAGQYLTVLVEGTPVDVGYREGAEGQPVFDAAAILGQLRNTVRVEGTMISVTRFADKAELSLDVADGKVRANGMVLGAVPKWQAREAADLWLEPHVIAILSGTVPKRDAQTGQWTFPLDARLRPKFDLDLFVEGRRITTDPRAEPRTIGPVLLVPLAPIVEALGSRLERGPEPNEVHVVRAQDNARFTLNLATGLVSVNGQPEGISPNMSYVEADVLLLPFTAVETLTGTVIALPVGSDRIAVSLDERLAGSVMPGQRIDAEAEATPLTFERLEFALSDSGPASADLTGRWNAYNGRLRYESAGALSAGDIAPGFLSLGVSSQAGWTGDVGDYNAAFRETQGVGVSRMRGLAWRERRENGDILAVSVGLPITGATSVADGPSVPEFGGLAAGVRRISADGRREIGLAVVSDVVPGETQAVASWQRDFDLANDEKGLTSAFVSVDAGAFSGAGGSAVDVRARADARYEFGPQVGVSGSLSYDGGRFAGGRTGLAQMEGVFNDDVSARIVASVSADWRAQRDWGVLRAPVAGVRFNVQSEGEVRTQALSGAVSTRIGASGPDVSLDVDLASGTDAAGREEATSAVSLRANQRFDWGTLTANASQTSSDNADTAQEAGATLTLRPFAKVFDKGVTVQIAPSLSAVWSPQASSVRAGASAAVDSGVALGERFSLRAQVSALQSVNASQSRTDLFTSVSGQWRITPRLVLAGSYVNDLRGTSRFSLGLRGALNFNAPRKHQEAKEGTGVLTGRVFLDRNRDGVRQEDEPGLPGVAVMVLGTRLALKVDREGHYTIQNLREGLFNVAVDRRSLPLGYLVPEQARARATVRDGHITTLDIPVIASGQVRGSVFLDANGNGRPDTGETRLEGALLELVAMGSGEVVRTQRAATFGQFGFENLDPGTYKLRIMEKGRAVQVLRVEVSEAALFVEVMLAVGGGGDGKRLEEPSVLMAALP